ncbi:O-methyltransferase [Blastococcus sp. Marseille-P5729]|uniref:O-methyltransferase n=1 Tax=Blastococcus sp. Marseille-P5729 TaxID=2086582 RepID=UPI000D113DFE|nr:O-methyltransferase [Blastococcus sp. Marseille-P5729]
MTNAASRTYVESFVTEQPVAASARQRAEELGVETVSTGAGAALRLLAAMIDARAVVEIGTGTGVSGLWLLEGMHPEGVLTTVDTEIEHQRAAKRAFAEAGVASSRARVITGAARDVLPRLTDGAYDLVFVDSDPADYAELLDEALRLLRYGGVVVFDDALHKDRVADPSARDAESVALRDLGRLIREHDHLVPAILPVGEGLIAAVHRPD